MDLVEWAEQSRRLLADLSTLDLGYPVGKNYFLEQVDQSVVEGFLRRRDITRFQCLRDFYSVCDGFNWPDVWNGYFGFRSRDLNPTSESGIPTRVKGHLDDELIVVASSGGGDLFGIACSSGQVVHLPVGEIVNGVYNDWDHRTRIIAPRLYDFLGLLLKDLDAFVRDDRSHRFLV